MIENPYKKLREDFEYLPTGYKLTSRKLAEEFADKTKPYYCPTLTHVAIRKLETGERYLKNFDEINAYRIRFNTTSDFLLGYTSVSEKDNATNEIVESVTGLSNDAIEMLKEWKRLRDKNNDFIPALGTDIDVINLLLEYQYQLTSKAKPSYPTWSIFHYIGHYLLPNKMKREQQDRLRICDGKVWVDVEIGDTLIKQDKEFTIQDTSAINSKSFSGGDTSKVYFVNSDCDKERYYVDADALFKSFAKDSIFSVLDKIKNYVTEKRK